MIHTQRLVTKLHLPNLPLFKEGKVRSVYDLGESLLLVASDRISAFDHILPTGIPQKGAVLTQLSAFWFDYLNEVVENHIISTDIKQMPEIVQQYRDTLDGRTMWVKKTDLIPIECVVRGYIIGSGWTDYQNTGQVCGISLPDNLQLADQLESPLFTPAYKADMGGHDENISFSKMCALIGQDTAHSLCDISIKLYQLGRDYAATKGIILADTKFEFGLLDDKIILIDEVLTPDSSRYWSASDYTPGVSPSSYDKQIARDYLASTWDKVPPAPDLPEHIIKKTSQKYLEVFERLTGV